MPRYSYTAYDDRGARTAGEVDAETRESALEALSRQGRFPLDLVEGGAPPAQRWWEREVFAPRQLSRRNLALLTRELATLVRAELPVDEALRIVSLQPLMGMRARSSGRSGAGTRARRRVAIRGVARPEGRVAGVLLAHHSRRRDQRHARPSLGRACHVPRAIGRIPRQGRLGTRVSGDVAGCCGCCAGHHPHDPGADCRAPVQGRGARSASRHPGADRRPGVPLIALAAGGCCAWRADRRGHCSVPQRALAHCA